MATDDIQELIRSSAKRHNVDPDFALDIARQESSFNPKAIGHMTPYGRAQGVFQLIPKTAKQYSVTDPLDARQNIEGAMRYLADLNTKHKGDRRKILIEYNSGPDNVDKPNSELPRETQGYLGKIMKNDNPYGDPAVNTSPNPYGDPPVKITREQLRARRGPSGDPPANPDTGEGPGFWSTVGSDVAGIPGQFLHPIRTLQEATAARLAEQEKAKQTTGLESFGHAVAGRVPFLGPFVAQTAEETGQALAGDKSQRGRAAAHLAELALPMGWERLPAPLRAQARGATGGALSKIPGAGMLRTAVEKWRSLSPAAKTQAARSEYLDAVSKELKRKPFEKLSQAEKTEIVRQADALPDIARREMEVAQAPPAQPGPVRQAAARSREQLANAPPAAPPSPVQPITPSPRVRGVQQPLELQPTPGPARQAAAQAREQLAGKTAPPAAQPAEPIPADQAAGQAQREARRARLQKETLPAPGETKPPTGETKPPKIETPSGPSVKAETDIYRQKGQMHGTHIERATIAKDANIGRFLKSKGFTQDMLDKMSESQWKTTIQEVNKAYGTSYETKARSLQSLMKRTGEIKKFLKETPPASPAGTEFPKTSEVLMRAPTGQTGRIPASDVEHYRSRGAEVIENA